MHHRIHALAASLAVLGVPPVAAAQGPDAAPPTRPGATAPTHPSAFADYQPFREIAPGDWRRVNDTVGQAALKPGAATPATPQATAASPAASASRHPMPMQPMHSMPHHHPPMHGGHR